MEVHGRVLPVSERDAVRRGTGAMERSHRVMVRRVAGEVDMIEMLCLCGVRLGQVKMPIAGLALERVRVSFRALAGRWMLGHLQDLDFGAVCGHQGCSVVVSDHDLGLCVEHSARARRTDGARVVGRPTVVRSVLVNEGG